ncbi:MAG: sulfurtransferase TusA family protein [Cyanobacteria bacterium]|nr:sulfurtransferase TusA family protein [Cyanobacteriota bacterium]
MVRTSQAGDDAGVAARLALDLRGTACPVNFIRTRLALETLEPGAWLQVDLDGGEPERLVADGLRQDGHRVQITSLEDGVRLLICRHGG